MQDESPLSMSGSARRHARWQFALVAAAFLGTPLIATLWYAYGDKGHLGDTVNKGALIDPPRAIEDAAALGLLDAWTLVVIAPDGCATECQRTLVMLRQVRLTLGHDTERVTRLLVSGSKEADRQTLGPAHPDLRFLATGDATPLLAQLGDFADARAAGRGFLVDPLGNLMMTYAPDAAPIDVKTDLVRLLKASAPWMKR